MDVMLAKFILGVRVGGAVDTEGSSSYYIKLVQDIDVGTQR
jgi:hypothetical protein